MPEYLAPGVYVEEVDTGSKPIEGVSTSTAGMIGMTRRGPAEGEPPVLVTSFPDFRRKFGGYLLDEDLKDSRYLAYAVEGFFQNGGKRVYIKRVPGKDNAAGTKLFAEASTTVTGGMTTRLAADTVFDTDDSGDDVYDASEKVRLTSLRGISVGTGLTFTQIIDGVITEEVSDVNSYDNDNNEVTLATFLTNRYQKKYTHVTVDDGIVNPVNTVTFTAESEGSWGNDINIQVKHASKGRTTSANWPVGTPSEIELNSINNFYIGAVIEIDNGTNRIYREITAINGWIITVDNALAAGDITVAAEDTNISTCEFSLLISYGDEQESFEFLSMKDTADNYFLNVINNDSELITATNLASGDGIPYNQPVPEDGLNIRLDGGDDGIKPDPDAYIGVDGGYRSRTGITALVDIDQISIVAIPGVTNDAVQNALIIHCETLKDRFAILDPPEDNNLQQVQDFRSNYDTKYAAIYYPWITIRDRLTNDNNNIPPSGHMAGIYARSDIERGVHKAPANEVIRGIVGLEKIINKGEQDILNPRPNHINVLRDFRKSGRGYRVWGARCITSDPDWKYVNVRRLFIYVEESIEEGTQWVVFEPNDEPTWARVRRSVTNFLTNVWRDGALQGRTPEQAFFVKCDRETMTQTDIDNGKLIMLIGIAPVKPAEFVIFRIGQWTGGVEIEEV